MGIYIRGLKFPKDGELLCVDIHPDGKVCFNLDIECKKIATAYSVSNHGDLVDHQQIEHEISLLSYEDYTTSSLREIIDNSPVVISADRDD